ncbi:MAG TPA: hypothetical protein VMV77_08960 [Bacteroidales bacterium]|nr:hypothetical protein [Bacteroidales bacterium]
MTEEWTILTSKRYLETRQEGYENLFNERLQSLKDIVIKNDELNTLKHESMNEIRAQLDKQALTFITEPSLKLIEQRVESLQKLVYIGLGVWLFLQLIIVSVLVFVFKL